MDIPKLGLWTWKITSEQLKQILPLAYEVGYRLFDTAWIYWNEEWVWGALYWLGIQRDKLFDTINLQQDTLTNLQLQNENIARDAYSKYVET